MEAVDRRPGERGGPGSAEWLALVRAFVEAITGKRRNDLVPALACLAAHLPARCVALLEFPPSGPVVLAGFGDFGHPLSDVVQTEDLGPGLHIESRTTTPGVPLITAILNPPGDPPLGFAVWGAAPGLAECEPLLATLLAVVHRLRPGWRRRLQGTTADAPPELVFPPGYVKGTSPAAENLYRQMEAVAATDLPVLLMGETGVGKEGLARALHLSSHRRERPFVALSCAAIPEDLLEAELFGIGKGVATGVSPRPGKFRLAQGGTLFLDEIGDMSPALQPKLLRALQEKEVETLGTGTLPIDVRVVAATNADLMERIESGDFRRDLYYRLAGFVLHIPPLRERREDIPALVERFLGQACHGTGKTVSGITTDALGRLAERRWPGNVRELEHEVQRLVCLCPDGGTIGAGMITEDPASDEDKGERPGPRSLDTEELNDLDLGRLEKRLVREALRRTEGNQVHAARLLGISRTALYRRARRFGLR